MRPWPPWLVLGSVSSLPFDCAGCAWHTSRPSEQWRSQSNFVLRMAVSVSVLKVIVQERGLTFAQSPSLTSLHSSHLRDGVTLQPTSSSPLPASSSAVSSVLSPELHRRHELSRAIRLRRSALRRPSRTTVLTSLSARSRPSKARVRLSRCSLAQRD